MNLKIHKRLMALPLSSAERAVVMAISEYVKPDGDSSYPSYKTIHEKSGAHNDTIAKVIRTLELAGILDRNHRADILLGKQSNLYRFTFEGIRFTRDKLSKADYAAFKAKLKKLRRQAVKEKPNKKPSTKRSVSANLTYSDTSGNAAVSKSQSEDFGIRVVTHSRGDMIPPEIEPIPPEIRSRSINSVPKTNDCTSQNSSPIHKGQSQKRVDQKENHYSTTHKKRPQDQSIGEWLVDHEAHEAAMNQSR